MNQKSILPSMILVPNPRSTRQPVNTEDRERWKGTLDPAAGELFRYAAFITDLKPSFVSTG